MGGVGVDNQEDRLVQLLVSVVNNPDGKKILEGTQTIHTSTTISLSLPPCAAYPSGDGAEFEFKDFVYGRIEL